MQIFVLCSDKNFKNRCKYTHILGSFANFWAKIFHFYAFLSFFLVNLPKKQYFCEKFTETLCILGLHRDY